MPRYRIISCEVLREELTFFLRGREGDFDVHWVEMGLHSKPEKLNGELRKLVAECAGKGYEAVLLLFGLCSRATEGLEAPDGCPLVIPRVHDCISLYLGSAAEYHREHEAEAGTYWFSQGFLHRTDRERGLEGLGAGIELGIDGEGRTLEEIRQSFIDDYGEDNAEYLIETLLESWKKNYTRAVYFDWEHNTDRPGDLEYVENYARDNGWKLQVRPANFRMLEAFLSGDWSKEFEVVEPGKRLVATNDGRVFATA